VLGAFSLRTPVTSLGALLGDVRHTFGMSGTLAGVATTLPVVFFCLLGLGSPLLARRFGATATLFVAMAAIAAGSLARAFTGSVFIFLLLSGVALAGIAVANVLIPAAVKRHFPARVGLLTGMYTMTMAAGTAAAAGLSVPIAHAFGGWRAGLAVWAVPAALGILPWLVALRRVRDGRGRAMPESRLPAGLLARSRIAWALTIFFGMQALGAYCVMGWLPEIYRSAGVDAATAGLLLAGCTLLMAPISLVLPAVAARRPDQRLWATLLTLVTGIGYGGLIVAPATGAWLWAVLIGIGSAAFPLALTMIGLRSDSERTTATLSAMAQGFGYMLAIPGPLAVGFLHDLTGGWDWPLLLLEGVLGLQLLAGLVAGAPHRVGEEPRCCG
jgi:CP family cyanate transporter-like MFS transporter